MGVLASLVDRSISGSLELDSLAIGDSALKDCSDLISVSFPNAIYLGDSALQNMSSLTTIDLPRLSNIRQSQFKNLSALNSLNVPKVTSIDLPTADTFGKVDPNGAFYGCTSLTSLTLPEIETLVGATTGGFYRVNYSVFNGSSLTSISLPRIQEIGALAFCDCSNLTTLYVATGVTGVCTLQNKNALPSSIQTIYVNGAKLDNYKSATNWSNYADKIVAAP